MHAASTRGGRGEWASKRNAKEPTIIVVVSAAFGAR